MENECSMINPECLAKKGITCPAKEQGKNCWEFDWIAVIKDLPEDEKKKWAGFMVQKCPSCPAFREQMQPMMERMKKEI